MKKYIAQLLKGTRNNVAEKTPYEILKVSTDASYEEIHKNYKSLALIYHPDKNKGNEHALAKFQEVTGAYNAIKQEREEKRKRDELYAA